MFSRNVTAMRTITAAKCRHRQRQRQRVLRLDRVVAEQRRGRTRRTPRASAARASPRAGSARPPPAAATPRSRAAARRPATGSRPAWSRRPARWRASYRNQPSTIALVTSAAPTSSSARPGRQPVSAEHRHDEAEQQQVPDRVGEVDRDHGAVLATSDDRAEDRAPRRSPTRRARPPPRQPQARAELPHPLAHEQHDRDVASWIEGQPQPVADTRHRRRVEPVEEQGVVGLTRGPCQQSDPQHEPRRPAHGG